MSTRVTSARATRPARPTAAQTPLDRPRHQQRLPGARRSGDYGGNPNPTHANQCMLDDGTMYPSPIAQPTKLPAEKRLLYYERHLCRMVWPSTPRRHSAGRCWAISSRPATWAPRRAPRGAGRDGKSVLFEEDLGIFSHPLDVAVGSDGSIYVADYGANDIQIMEPDPNARTVSGTPRRRCRLPTQEVGSVACNGKVYVLGGQNSAGGSIPTRSGSTTRLRRPGRGDRRLPPASRSITPARPAWTAKST